MGGRPRGLRVPGTCASNEDRPGRGSHGLARPVPSPWPPEGQWLPLSPHTRQGLILASDTSIGFPLVSWWGAPTLPLWTVHEWTQKPSQDCRGLRGPRKETETPGYLRGDCFVMLMSWEGSALGVGGKCNREHRYPLPQPLPAGGGSLASPSDWALFSGFALRGLQGTVFPGSWQMGVATDPGGSSACPRAVPALS